MLQLLSEVPFDEALLRHFDKVPGLKVHFQPLHREAWDMPGDFPRGPDFILSRYPPKNLEKLTNVKLNQFTSVGYEHMRHMDLADKPVRFCNARGLYDTAIAEWIMAMLINLRRDERGMMRNQDQGIWDRAPQHHQEIRDRIVGIWGYGGIGRETARLAKAFGMKVHVMTRSGVKPRRDMYVIRGTGDPEGILPDRQFTLGREKEFLSGLDFLVLALPRTIQSEGMIGEEQLKALPRTACLLNPARGRIVQEKSLIRALTEGWIKAAALDTHPYTPMPPDHPLWRMPNVIMTPHISGAEQSIDYPGRIADLAAENISRFLTGRPLLNVITPKEFEESRVRD